MAAGPARETSGSDRTTPPPARPRTGRRFRFEIGWSGMFGLVVVSFCLLLWMFLLGIWAGQTILLPIRPVPPAAPSTQATPPSARVAAPPPAALPAGENGQPGRLVD